MGHYRLHLLFSGWTCGIARGKKSFNMSEMRIYVAVLSRKYRSRCQLGATSSLPAYPLAHQVLLCKIEHMNSNESPEEIVATLERIAGSTEVSPAVRQRIQELIEMVKRDIERTKVA